MYLFVLIDGERGGILWPALWKCRWVIVYEVKTAIVKGQYVTCLRPISRLLSQRTWACANSTFNPSAYWPRDWTPCLHGPSNVKLQPISMLKPNVQYAANSSHC